MSTAGNQDSSAIYRTVIENFPHGVGVIDASLRLIVWNHQFQQLQQFPDALLARQTPCFPDLLRYQASRGEYGPGDPERHVQAMLAPENLGKPQVSERTRPDGTVLEMRTIPLPEGGCLLMVTDISQRKRADREARHMASYLQTVLDNLPFGVALVDKELDFAYWNHDNGRFLDFHESFVYRGIPMEKVVRAFAERGDYGPGDIEGKVARRMEYVRRFEPNRVEIRQANGRVKEVRTIPIIENGEPSGLLLLVEDISERAQKIDSMEQEAASKLRQIVDGCPVPIFVIDAKHRVTHWNKACEMVTGVTASSMIGTSNQWQGFYHEERPVMADIVISAEEEGGVALERHYAGKYRRSALVPGSYEAEDFFPELGEGGRWLYFTAAPLKDGNGRFRGSIETLQDVTERRQAEEVLRLSEQRFSAMFLTSPVPLTVVETSADGKLINVNRAWEKKFGRSKQEVLDKSGLQFPFWKDPADRVKLYRDMSEHHEVNHFEAWLVCADSPEPILCWISGRRFDLDGKQFAIFSFEDITAQRQAENDLREFNLRLEHRVEERTVALQEALGELGKVIDNLQQTQNELVRSEKLAALGSIVAGVAHELNTPIGNSLMVASHVLETSRKFAEQAKAGLRRSTLDEFVADISAASDILVRGLNKAAELVSSFKQVAVDQTSSQRREFSLREVVAEVVLTMGSGLRKAHCTVVQDIHEDIVMNSFPGPLGQILTNLINNAILHGFEGRDGGNICISAQAADADGRTTIIVSDDGIGIPENVIPRIFDPFFTTKLGSGGSGLGLNIVHNMVTGLLGGRIAVTSRAGKGSQFVLTLPLVAPQQADVVIQ